MSAAVENQEFTPERMSRRGEYTAWGMALLTAGAWIILDLASRPLPGGFRTLAVFLVVLALGISLSNWMDRRTSLQLGPEGVHFNNGLRNVTLDWGDIRRVEVLPGGWGKKVRVIGSSAYFEFRTLGEVRVQGDVKGRMGFPEGDKILQTILQKGGLHLVEETSGGARYYSAD